MKKILLTLIIITATLTGFCHHKPGNHPNIHNTRHTPIVRHMNPPKHHTTIRIWINERIIKIGNVLIRIPGYWIYR